MTQTSSFTRTPPAVFYSSIKTPKRTSLHLHLHLHRFQLRFDSADEVNSAKLVQLQKRPKQYAGRCSLACLLQYNGLKIWVLGGYNCKRFVGAEVDFDDSLSHLTSFYCARSTTVRSEDLMMFMAGDS
ncbi:hypothetical protein MKW98_009548 [Papaver atlanticum]|uniref:Uncharacterized protein n=1 Tax=Papaver atlanticum TaxID=357466 RepID=A0AAD4SJ91_9MAGN|nr:hypothetical protein MKW98_009548 [Papaver atlanticum]